MLSGILSQLTGRFGRGATKNAPADSAVTSPESPPLTPLSLCETAGERDVWAAYYQRCVARGRGYLAANEAAFVARSDHGCLPLAEDDLPFYAALYGGHHIAKLTAAFAATDLGKLSGATLEIYDWGCGQAIASCLLIDFLRELCVRCSVRRVTLIEPAYFALERGTELLTRTLGVEGYIRAICGSFGDLTPEAVRAASPGDVKIHLFSNILDVDGVDLWRLVKLISEACPGRNEFICISPRYRASRLWEFYRNCQTAFGPASVMGCSQNRESMAARIFDARRGAFKEHVITRDEVRFSSEIQSRTAGKPGKNRDEISDPFGRESFAVRASGALRKFFRGD